jgi:RimJ/RimL family protein N-acetyltransferase
MKEQKKYVSRVANQPSIAVRKATKRDVSTILKNLKMVAKEQVYLGVEKVAPRYRKNQLDRLKDKKCLTIVAVVEGRVVGSLTLWHNGLKKMSHVRELGILVIQGYREIGVGRALMDYALSWARKQKGVEKVELGVFSTNRRAMRLYKSFGFRVEGVLRRQHVLKGKYADEFRMAVFV